MLDSHDISIAGYIATAQEQTEILFGLLVLNAEEILRDNIGIIIGLNSFKRVEAMKYLDSCNFDMCRIIQSTDFIEKDNSRYDNSLVMEITTKIGCSVNCKYCPQSLLLKNYYADNAARKTMMSLGTFEACLNNCSKIVS